MPGSTVTNWPADPVFQRERAAGRLNELRERQVGEPAEPRWGGRIGTQTRWTRFDWARSPTKKPARLDALQRTATPAYLLTGLPDQPGCLPTSLPTILSTRRLYKGAHRIRNRARPRATPRACRGTRRPLLYGLRVNPAAPGNCARIRAGRKAGRWPAPRNYPRLHSRRAACRPRGRGSTRTERRPR